jgi:hypothetical protein
MSHKSLDRTLLVRTFCRQTSLLLDGPNKRMSTKSVPYNTARALQAACISSDRAVGHCLFSRESYAHGRCYRVGSVLPRLSRNMSTCSHPQLSSLDASVCVRRWSGGAYSAVHYGFFSATKRPWNLRFFTRTNKNFVGFDCDTAPNGYKRQILDTHRN